MSETRCNVLAHVKVRHPHSSKELCCICSRVFVYNKEGKFHEEVLDDMKKLVLNGDQVIDYENIEENLSYEKEALDFPCSDKKYHSRSVEGGILSSQTQEEIPTSRSFPSDIQWTDSYEGKLILDWHKFWSSNGEKLIWASWIRKYSSFIDPGYLNHIVDEECKLNLKEESNNTELHKLRTYETNKKLTQCKVSESDKILNESWNSLSPTTHRLEAEQLFGVSCASNKSSSKLTFDSMTNVTGTSLSSNNSSQNLSDSLSSVSSEDLSSSTAQEEEEENENKWNNLWKIHYEEEYLRQYNNFVGRIFKKKDQFPVDFLDGNKTTLYQEIQNNRLCKAKVELYIVSDSESDSKESVKNEVSVLQYQDKDELNQMVALGLPVSFGKKKTKGIREFGNDTAQVVFEDQISSNNKILAAFKLIGMEFSGQKEKILGEVEYKRKNIRSQNALLRIGPLSKQPRHFHFDDEGNVPTMSEGATSSKSNNFIVTSDSTEELTNDEVSSKELVELEDIAPCRKRKAKKRKFFPQEINTNPKLKKYWHRRFSLFRRFDEGIKLDEESWYSVTPESIAQHTASRCKTGVIIDAFCGAGGNMIQFALTCDKVIAIDNDPKKIELAKNNAEVYGVAHKIDFIVGDFLSLTEKLKADVVFLSPPWGGPSYLKNPVYDLETMLLPVPFSKLMDSCRKVSENIAIFLPKNSNIHDVVKNSGDRSAVEIEQNFINGNLIGITLYYNNLIRKT